MEEKLTATTKDLARQNIYTLVEQAHERNPEVSPDVIDVLVEEAREATQDCDDPRHL